MDTMEQGILSGSRSIKVNFPNGTGSSIVPPKVELKEMNVDTEIKEFPLIPYPTRVYVVEEEVEKFGGLFVPASSRKEGEMQTNIGYVVGVGESITFCAVRDRILYGRYSGSWVMEKKYRVMNEEDILGRFKLIGFGVK